MNRRFTAAWLVFGVFLVFTEFMAPTGWQDTLRMIAVGIFIVAEGLAIGRPAAGDTLTEHIRKFYAGEKARIALVLSWALYFPVALVDIAVDPDLAVGRVPLTALILSLGVLGWAIPHLLAKEPSNA